MNQFELKFKGIMYKGISIQRVVPGTAGKGNSTLERRILWLMLPEEGSLRLGFLSKTAEESRLDVYNNDVYRYPVRGSYSSSTLSTDDSAASYTDVSTSL